MTDHHSLTPISGTEISRLIEAESPSARFGWHANFHSNVKQAVGWLIVFSLLLLNIGNHQGHIEDFYLAGTAMLVAIVLVRELYLRYKSPTPRN